MMKLALACSLGTALTFLSANANAYQDEPIVQPKANQTQNRNQDQTRDQSQNRNQDQNKNQTQNRNQDQNKNRTQKHDETSSLGKEDVQMPKKGIAVLVATQGNQVSGMLMFDQQQDGLHITGTVRGLTPGDHGFHVHEFGDLSKPDGTAAGDHFAPEGKKHGSPDDEEHHAGDLGNITADENGVSKVDITSKDLKLHFILGRAIVVHGGADDLKSQPSGNSGPRVALGVIGLANEKSQSPSKATSQQTQPKKNTQPKNNTRPNPQELRKEEFPAEPEQNIEE